MRNLQITCAVGVLAAAFVSFGEITIRSDYPGGNVKVCGIDEANGIVRFAPDLRDTQGKWFHWDFTLRGAAGRKLRFVVPDDKYEYLSSLGPAISKDGGRTWTWLRPDGTRHEPANAFDYTFGPDENETRFAKSIPYSQKDWDAFIAKWRGKGVECGVLCKSQSGARDTELARIPCRKGAKWLFAFTARHHACETSANAPMEGVVEAILSGTPEGEWLRDNADCVFVPFMDKDGVENGDQGKNRRPYDHNRDYLKGRYTSVRALKELLVKESEGKQIVFIDMHSPHVRSMPNSPEQDQVFSFGCRDERLAAHWNEFRKNWKETQKGGKLVYDGKYDIEGGKGYALVIEKQWANGFMSSDPWVRTLPNCYLATCCEFGYSLCGGVYSLPAARELGGNMLKALVRTAQSSPSRAGQASGVSAAPVAFKDAAKIKSWDAWGDGGKTPTTWTFKERKCVTLAKIRKMSSDLEPAGQLEVRPAKAIRSNMWSVGCETMDRDYADWDQYKNLLGGLGATRGRLFSGWAKTEQEKGKYDFTWLDPQVREMAAMGVKPWICISYGNPVWGSDFRLGMKVRQVTDNPEAFAAWLRYVKALVARYKDVVDEWEIWNEPFGQRDEYALMVYETAKAVHEVQPNAICLVTAISWNKDPAKNDYVTVLEKLKKENALGLVKWWIYHPYTPVPESCYPRAMELRQLVKSYSSEYDILQGETGCPSQLEFAHAMHSIEWTEYAQAKWDLRRAVGDYVRNIPSSCFTFIDLQYTFMLQSFGLVRSNTLKQPVYRRPSYFAMQNVYSYFDEDVHPISVETRTVNGKEMTVAKFERQSRPVWAVWFSGERPNDKLEYECANLEFLGKLKDYVWVDLMRGRIGLLPSMRHVPVWDSPVLIAPNSQVPRRTVWKEMKPAEIVDALYRPHQGLMPGGNGAPRKMDVANEPWTKMATKDFLPCFDKYGQFKYREWPGKTHSDAELKAVAAEEEKDLAAHPGPAGWNKYGGWAAGPQLKATGRFRTEKRDGKWWLVDPEGRLFWSWGAVRVTPSSAMTPLNGNPRTPRCGGDLPPRDCLFEGLPKKGEPLAAYYETYDDLLKRFYLIRNETRWFDFSSANLHRKYGADWFAKYSDSCHRRLRSWGANTIANSSDLRICLQDRTPYAERVEVDSRTIAASWGSWFKFRDPFDPSFTTACTAALAAHGREAHDPWCIGFFIDNEIQWGAKETDLAQWSLWSPDDQPAKVEFVKRLAAKGIDPKKDAVPEEELKAFTRVLAEEYFKRTREAVKAFDPGLLYLGCRFAGSARPWAVTACAKYCDVVSYNIYSEDISAWRLPQKLDAPVMIGEFHFGAHDRGLFGASLINKGSQEGRAAALKRYVESALANPQIVGVHWHQFSDQATSGRFDGEYFQVGWTDICDRPYPETVAAVRDVGYRMYETRSSAH